ncbi:MULTISPECIES: hypothetical protein [unclassified Endozoicomonas]|uniref:hypothetical protein n=1 Tax=unclassified Endozoicomonas TaxID=2644528 RepID=UPI002148A3ED|nr:MULTISPECIES: hypothetical protein [unclassified Endozoicomonas]
MTHSIAQLPTATKQSIFFQRNKAHQSVAASLGLIMMVCPCSKLLAKNPFSMPVEEIFTEDKTTKTSSFLDDLINHNVYLGTPPPFTLNPNTTHLIFALNHENERDEKMDVHTEEPQGAEALQPQPLMQIPLPLITHAQITANIQQLNTGLNGDALILNTMLSYVPVTLPNESLTILSMIQQVKKALHVESDENQNVLLGVLINIQGTESPVDITRPEDQQSLAMLMVSYYTAIHCKGAHPQAAYWFFHSFLLHAASLSGIDRLDAKKVELLGAKTPIEDHKILKANIEESNKCFIGLKVLEKMRLIFLSESEKPSQAEKYTPSADPLLIAAFSLLNYDINQKKIPIYQRNIKSAKRMSSLIKEYRNTKPELVASCSQFVSLINAISLMLDPFSIQLANTHLDNLSSYFSLSNWLDTNTDSSGIKGKEQALFGIFEKVLKDARDNPGNEKPELFQELLLTLEQYIEKQLPKAFIEEDYYVIMVVLGTEFSDLLEQSVKTLAYLATNDTVANQQADGANYDETVEQEGKEFSEEKKKKKYLKERIDYLEDFVGWFGLNYDFAMNNPCDSDSSDYRYSHHNNIDYGSGDSNSTDSGSSHRNSIDYGSGDSDSSDSGGSHRNSIDYGSIDYGSGDSESSDAVMGDTESSDTDRPDNDRE